MSSDFGTPGEKLPVSEDELVDREVLSPNHNERTMPIQMVVIHYTEMQDKGFAIERLCDPEAQVSAHYLIGEQGEVVRLVPEEKRAWHAGVAYWRGHKDVNSASIGIELDHPGHKYGYREFNEAQFQALVPLVARIVKRYDIPRANVIGHSDVAPARKIDPGELFPWDRLAARKDQWRNRRRGARHPVPAAARPRPRPHALGRVSARLTQRPRQAGPSCRYPHRI